MDFEKKYYDKFNRYIKGQDSTISKMGNWRSRWERYRDLQKQSGSNECIERIVCEGTAKDYIVKAVYGKVSNHPRKKRFKITPIKEEAKRDRFVKKAHNDYCRVGGKRCDSCLRNVNKANKRKNSISRSKKKSQ